MTESISRPEYRLQSLLFPTEPARGWSVWQASWGLLVHGPQPDGDLRMF
jgi:hypothetical protein